MHGRHPAGRDDAENGNGMMSKRRHLGYILVVAVATAGIAAAVYFLANEHATWQTMTVIGMGGVVACLLRGAISGAWTYVAVWTGGAFGKRRDAVARRTQQDTSQIEAAAARRASLVAALRAPVLRRGSRLLVTGERAVVQSLLPGLVEAGHLAMPQGLLLWCETGKDGQADADWLGQIYRSRRRRPVDAIVLVADGDTAPAAIRRGSFDTPALPLARIADLLHWSPPVFAVSAARIATIAGSDMPVVACELPPAAGAAAVTEQLKHLANKVAWRGLIQAGTPSAHHRRCLLEMSEWLQQGSRATAEWVAAMTTGHGARVPVRGVAFVPALSLPDAQSEHGAGIGLRALEYLSDRARLYPGRRSASHPMAVGCAVTLAAIGIWIAGMVVSGVMNAADLHRASASAAAIEAAPDAAARLRALLALQHQIEDYEFRVQHHAPLVTRFGLNRDPEVLAALWKPYSKASRTLLVAPAVESLEAALVDLSQLPLTRLDEQTSRWALGGHDALKAYLMLANPERADAEFLRTQLPRHWSTDARITPGERLDLAERLFAFHAAHLKSNPDWRIAPQAVLIAGARQTLLAVIGERNAQDTIYRGVIEGVGSKYPDLTLASLTPGTAARGLLHATTVVPGAFTRQAYEGHVAAAIEQAGKRMEIASDWVLADDQSPGPARQATQDLGAALAQQYFTEYADHWQRFMNTLQWVPASTLSASAEQLKLAADARQSPVIALMKSLEYHGGAGARREALSDALVAKAQDLMGRKANVPEALKADPAGPLGAAFGPVLRLVGQAQPAAASGAGDLSLQRFLDRTTALRLRLQQLGQSADGDAQARQMAQALFQGKGSELAEIQAYAQLMAASLGAQWAGMGEALFVRPIAQATQAVLQPAQASINEAWREGIVTNWYRAFAGRYPFADTQNDASLAELSRFLKPQGGSIPTFLGAHLAGVLVLQGERWTPVEGNALTFDPAFLTALNTLQRIANRMMVHGDAQYRFELKPVPTPGLVDTVLTLDGQQLHYYNQRETWHPMRWPAGDPQAPLARLQWQTEAAGTSKDHEFIGRWALLRLLERAHVEPLDSATFQLTWQARPDTSPLPDTAGAVGPEEAGEDAERLTPREPLLAPPADITHPLRYLMRTEAGLGPLDLLALRGFTLPARIFVGGSDRRT